MKLNIRGGEKEDFDQFYQLFKIFEKEYNHISISENFTHTKKQIINDFKNKLKNYFIVAEAENEIIGYLEGILYKEWKRGYISDMFILKKFRNKGIASQMKDLFIKELRKKNYNVVSLDVNIKNPAVRIYKKWGFKIIKYRMVKKI